MTAATRAFREHLGLEDVERDVPTGSMWPSIRPGERIRFRRTQRAPRIGEIWVAELGQVHVCHRVLFASRSRVYFKGDWSPRPDGWIPRAQLFGPLSHVRRAGQWQPTNRRRDRAAGLALTLVGSAVQLGRMAGARIKRRLLAHTT